MKQKKLNKLTLKKETITHLENSEAQKAKGGFTGDTCLESCYICIQSQPRTTCMTIDGDWTCYMGGC